MDLMHNNFMTICLLVAMEKKNLMLKLEKSDCVTISASCAQILTGLIMHVYRNLNKHIVDHKWIPKRAILAPINVNVNEINFSIQAIYVSVQRYVKYNLRCASDMYRINRLLDS